MLGFVIVFSSAVTIAWWTGAGFTLLSVGCVIFMLVLRSWAQSIRSRSETVSQTWEDALFSATGVNDSLFLPHRTGDAPLLSQKDLPHFLHDWNYLHESLAGESKAGLSLLGESLKIEEGALSLLKSPFVDKQLLAINTLGNLGLERSYPTIENLITSPDPLMSSWAWRALFRINVERTIEKHLDEIATRRDWSPIFVAKVLKEIESDTLSPPLCGLTRRSFDDRLEERQMSRLISYLIFTHVADYRPIVNDILLKSDEKEVLIACLRLVNSDDDLTRIRGLINDERWEVRLQVVMTLGRLAHEEDCALLVSALDDHDWWVRYRAAGVLLSMPGMTQKKLKRLTKTLPSQFARDILGQVIAEHELLCFRPTTSTLSR